MATLSCVTEGDKNSYTCTGTAGACTRAIVKLKTVDVADSPVPELGELRVLDALPEPGDAVRVGLRKFQTDTHDIVVHEMGDDTVTVVVFDGRNVVFQGLRPKSLVEYVPGDRSGSLPFREALQAEDFVRIDIEDLNRRRII